MDKWIDVPMNEGLEGRAGAKKGADAINGRWTNEYIGKADGVHGGTSRHITSSFILYYHNTFLINVIGHQG